MNNFLSKKSPSVFLFALAGLAIWSGCEKDETDPLACKISGVTFTYNTNIKGIIDRNCISCHATGSGVPDAENFDFRTYEGLKEHLDDGHVLDRVVVKKDMPQGGGTMTQAERDSINCWIQAGYPK